MKLNYLKKHKWNLIGIVILLISLVALLTLRQKTINHFVASTEVFEVTMENMDGGFIEFRQNHDNFKWQAYLGGGSGEPSVMGDPFHIQGEPTLDKLIEGRSEKAIEKLVEDGFITPDYHGKSQYGQKFIAGWSADDFDGEKAEILFFDGTNITIPLVK